MPDDAVDDVADHDKDDLGREDDGEDKKTQRDAVPPGSRPRRREPDPEMLDILREEREREERLRAAGEASDISGETSDDAENDVTEPAPEPEVDKAEAEAVVEHRAQAATERARMAAAASLARARARSSDSRERGAPSGRVPEPAQDDDVDMSDVIAATLRDASVTQVEEDDPDEDILAEDDAAANDTAPTSSRSARRELLPDIEEINSSLRPDERAAEAEALSGEESEAPEEARRSSGFRIGFLLMCAIIIVLLGVYVFAGQISEAVPQLATMLSKYVAWVDEQRVALAAATEALTASIAPDR
ncbi:hypothetical protein SAMN05444004_102322 [Jannaschia faecimaris]|uniref:Uncharacterized protein n=2 Tax=Jannaschia faecimaris TaxID=1244108 RepID=A0A1H3LW37_9RHOB|nr:hypothetical protein SAMN05444004_102322 [Jannaschia faecimaris]